MHYYMKKYSLVSVGADASGLVILLAVDVGTVVESAVAPAHWPPALLVLEVPVEAGEGAVLLALVLQEQRALLHAELFQIPATNRTQLQPVQQSASFTPALPSNSNRLLCPDLNERADWGR